MIIKGAIKGLASNGGKHFGNKKKKVFFFFLPLHVALCVFSPPNVNETSQYTKIVIFRLPFPFEFRRPCKM